ncbi:MAG: hypothetical protein R3C59_14910 [Planctomycetaceae bacterium]
MNTGPLNESSDISVTAPQWCLACVVGLVLAVAVWWPLVQGGGLVGGDVYPYFLPQKVVLAESMANSEIPLWHNRTGLGYPLLAESQAGVFYPPNQILYRVLDVNAAYNANVLLHYWLAFVFAWRFGRCQGISTWPALLAAMVFVYGWFPARISWEWSIFGGVFFPLTLWLTDRFVRQPDRYRFAALSLCFAVYLLAGHFTLAFISQLSAIAYATLWVLLYPSSASSTFQRLRVPACVAVAVLTALMLAAVQIVPTFELKQLSQRSGSVDSESADERTPAFDPAFGHVPPLYLTQTLASWWYWHSPEIVASGGIQKTPFAVSADTNVVEAHLYWGLIPLGLLCLLVRPSVRRRVGRTPCRIWGTLIPASLIYATGWLLPVTRHLPGFGFFNGPGRYTIVSALGGAVLAGLVLDVLLKRRSLLGRILVTTFLSVWTLPDLLWSATYVADATAVTKAPLAWQDESWLRHTFVTAEPLSVRLLAPGPNVANLFGVSSVPQYLGLGPQVYYLPKLWPDTAPGRQSPSAEFPTTDQLVKIQHLGITHILTTEPVQNPSSALVLLNAQPDALLNSIWGRGGEPCYLYQVESATARIASRPADALTQARLVGVTANSIRFEVDMADAAEVELRELMYPGWQVQIDDVPAQAVPSDGMFRIVAVPAGKHTVSWTFQPGSFHIGIAISCVTLLVLGMFCGLGRRVGRRPSLPLS